MLKFLLVISIKAYQRYVSPIKGFNCAHNHLYGEGSCSNWALSILDNKGVIALCAEMPTRIEQCNDASEKIKENSDCKKHDSDSSNVDKCCIPAEITSCWMLWQ